VHPELAVVVPSIGRARPRETVESILASAHAGEISAEVALAWQSLDPAPPLPGGADVVEVLPLGAAYARNRAGARTKAPIVAFVDDDELVDPDWARGLVGAFAANPEIAAVCGAIAPLDDRGLPYCSFSGGEERRYSGAATLPWTVGGGGNMAVRRDVLDRLRGFDIGFGPGTVARSADDSELIKRIFLAGYEILWTPNAVVYHPSKDELERLESRPPYGFGMGKLVRRHRDVRGATAYAVFAAQSYLTGAVQRNRRRRREAAATFRAFVGGALRRSPWLAPLPLLDRMPEALRTEIDASQVQGLPVHYRPNPHFVYLIDDGRVLHVYSAPSPALRAAVVDRELIRTSSGVGGIPRVLAWSEGTDSLWLVEERHRGGADGTGVTLRAALEWATAMAKPLGPQLRESDGWDELRALIEADAPAPARRAVTAACERLGELASAHSHGDFQRKNISLTSGRIAVFDWEWARARDLPGADLLFYAVTAGSGEQVVRTLAAGGEPLEARLRPLLTELGVADEQAVHDLLLVMLVRWAGNEHRWLAQWGTREQTARYAELLGRCAPVLLDRTVTASVS
jgi:hypothetical protein